MTPDKIEKIMLIPNYRSVYFIGCIGAGKITIHSQQIRAFNLAYALIKNRKLSSKKRVAIIGGGISGITIASAISKKCECKIDIYETRQEILDLQRNSDRYVHPNIFDWPINGADEKKTSLPLLNWKAAKIDSVVKKFDAIWENVKSQNLNIKVYTKVSVGQVDEISDGNIVFSRLTFKAEKRTETSTYDYVIYAGGVGLEKHERGEFLSYWEKDKYESNVVFLEKKFKIYGTGDGGLIDCIRISLKKFDYQNLVEQFSKKTQFSNLGNCIKNYEEDVKQQFENSKHNLSRKEVESKISEELNKIYKTTFNPTFKELSSTLFELYIIREKVSVTLFGKTPYPYNLHSSLLNRLIVFFLLQKGVLKYKQLPDDTSSKTIRHIKLFVSRVYNFFTKTVVIERLGPERPYMELFRIEQKDIDTYKSERLLLGIEKHWTDNFFDDYDSGTIYLNKKRI